MVELAVAVAACTVLTALVWWYDSRSASEWEDLLSPEARQAYEVLRTQFRAEERVVDWTLKRTEAAESQDDLLRLLGAGGAFLAGLIPGRVELLHRLALYSRIIAAAAPPPKRLRVRLTVLRRAFGALLQQRREVGDEWHRFAAAREEFRALDDETLEAWRLLVDAVAGDSLGGTLRRKV